MEEEHQQELDAIREQQKREKEQRRLVAIEKQRAKEQALEEARQERLRRAEEQRREALMKKEAKEKEKAEAAERYVELSNKAAASLAERQSVAKDLSQVQEAKRLRDEERQKEQDEERKKKEAGRKKIMAKQAALQKVELERQREEEAAKKAEEAERALEQKAALREAKEKRALLEKEAAEARRHAKKEHAAKKLQDERDEAERRRKGRRMEALREELGSLRDERSDLEGLFLDKLSQHERLAKMTEDEFVALDRITQTLGFTLETGIGKEVLDAFPEKLKMRVAMCGCRVLGCRAMGAVWEGEAEGEVNEVEADQVVMALESALLTLLTAKSMMDEDEAKATLMDSTDVREGKAKYLARRLVLYGRLHSIVAKERDVVLHAQDILKRQMDLTECGLEACKLYGAG